MVIEYRSIIHFTQESLAFRHLLKYGNHNLDKTCCCWKSCSNSKASSCFRTVEEEDKSNIHFLTPLQTCLNLVFVPRHRFPFVPLLTEIEALQQEESLKHKIGRNTLDLFTFLLMSGGWSLSRFMIRISQFDKDVTINQDQTTFFLVLPWLCQLQKYHVFLVVQKENMTHCELVCTNHSRSVNKILTACRMVKSRIGQHG